ncbi:MAG: serine/threonine protein kinase [Betaproteobacteria bacterium]|nr:serine/threonine protein kinase [Betaproteobacteria bacterium]
MSETSYLNKLTEITKAYQDGDLGIELLNQQVEDLIDACDQPSEDFFVQLQKLVQDSDLPQNVSESLLNKISQIELDYSQTKVVDDIDENIKKISRRNTHNKLSSELQHENQKESPPNLTGDSVLLQNLLNWNKAGKEKKIEPNVIIRGTYRLVSKIGEGGMGEVWKAIDLIQDAGEARDRYVAIKFLNQEIQGKEFALKALVREFARYKKLIHPNLIRAYELNRDENLLFIVMEFLAGVPLDKYIQDHPNGVDPRLARPIIKGMCDALEHSHQEGIIHLDFKPSNVFYNPETGAIKVIDFGIARLAEKQDRDLTRFDPGVLGAKTKAYATPEMMIDADPHPCDDVYGLSCVIYEILTGKHPFKQLNVISAEAKALKPAPIKNFNKSQLKALEQGLAFHRKDRIKSANKLYQALFPQLQTSWPLSRNSLLVLLVLITILIIPALYITIDNRQLQNIANGIKVLNPDSINKFHNLDSESQLKIVIDETIGLSLVKYYISIATPGITALDYIQKFDADVQDDLLHKRDNRRLLATHSENLIDRAIQENEFNLATKIADRFGAQYPDSKKLANQITFVSNARNEQLAKLQYKFNQCLNDVSNTLVHLASCLYETADQLRNIDPNLNVLNSPQLSKRFIDETRDALATKNLHIAEKLLLAWNNLLPNTSEERIELTKQLEKKKEIEGFISRISAAKDTELNAIALGLLTRDPLIKKTVLLDSESRDKLKNWYQRTVQESIDANNFKALTAISSQATKVFSDNKAMRSWLNDLERNILTNREKNIQTLLDKYNSLLKQDELNANALQDTRQKVLEIDPKNNLINYPRVRETYSRIIMTAINHGQFELAKGYLQDWRILRPEDANTNLFKTLSKKYQDGLNAAQRRNSVIGLIKADLKNRPFGQALDKIDSLDIDFPGADKKIILESIKIPFLQPISDQIKSAVQRNDYITATQLANIAFQYYPDEQAVINQRNAVDNARTNQIKTFLTNYQTLLKNDSLNGTDLFIQLKSIDSIDKEYISHHPELYKALSDRLKELMVSVDHSLVDLKNVLTQWEGFLKSKENSSENNTLFESTKDYIALQCLFKGRIFKSEGEFEQAKTYINFGLSLKPTDRIRTPLAEELNSLLKGL